MNELRVGALVVVAGVTLIPVERLRIVITAQRQGCWFQTTKDVFALMVLDTRGVNILSTDGYPLSIDHLLDEVPGLQAVLQAISRGPN